jgi:Ca2+-binding RTX toxin-like protein
MELRRSANAQPLRLVSVLSLIYLVVLIVPETATAAVTCFGKRATLVGTNRSERLVGTTGSDVIVGLGGNDLIKGLGGNDRICAGTDEGGEFGGFDDVVYAGPGDDRVAGDGGPDVLYGGTGTDHLNGGADPDQLLGQAGGDLLNGGGSDDSLAGGNGNDLLTGGEAADVLEGGLGADTVSGGLGLDQATFVHASGSVQVNLSSGTSTGSAGTDRLTGIEEVVGSNYADRLTASGTGSSLDGGPGDDLLLGGAGDDLLVGGSGADTLEGLGSSQLNFLLGGDGNDQLFGGSGEDTLAGGNGDDTLTGGGGALNILEGGPANDSLIGESDLDVAFYPDSAGPVQVNLESGTATGDGTDALVSIDGVVGSPYGDTLVGDAGNDIFLGLDGNDLIQGGDGIDGMEGGSGDDTLDGEEGANDFAAYFGSGSGVHVDLVAGTAIGDGVDTLLGIEGIDGSNFDDTLSGDGIDNFFVGNGGNDAVDGGKGFDLMLFPFAPGPVQADLAAGTATGEGADSLLGLEVLDGSPFADTLQGDAGDNSLLGEDGDDLLDGRDGIDYLEGGDDEDTCLNGELGLTTCEHTSLSSPADESRIDLSSTMSLTAMSRVVERERMVAHVVPRILTHPGSSFRKVWGG